MANPQKLYQILEKAEIETKIAIEIQDWILDTIDENRVKSMTQFEETKLLPMHLEMRKEFASIRSEMDLRFARVDDKFGEVDRGFLNLESKMDARFTSLEKRLDATNFSIRLLGVPIVGATIGGLGVVFLQIYERIAGL
ncbi:MAG: hypothetical protein O9264_12405 [Leptospira sp.]|jgi:hypothetical protein|nr:hypothetical protein [Leptospira sp.]